MLTLALFWFSGGVCFSLEQNLTPKCQKLFLVLRVFGSKVLSDARRFGLCAAFGSHWIFEIAPP